MVENNPDEITELQKIFINVVDREGIENLTPIDRKQKALKNITTCRTPEAELITSVCPSCGYTAHHYASCNDSACPLCGESKRESWIAYQSQFILDVPYYHIVFTVPHELNKLFLAKPKEMYNILFQAASEALKKMGKDPKFLGAEQMGFMMMIHTFGSNLSFHPHIHCLVAGCGLDKDKKMVFVKKKKSTDENGKSKNKTFFVPAKALAKVFRGKFLEAVKEEISEDVFDDSKELQQLLDVCWKKNFNIEIRERTNNKEAVMEYLGRYINRTAITNSRINSYDETTGMVTFTWKDYRDDGTKKKMTIKDDEFVRRFLMHVLPARFTKIRFYGFWGNRSRIERFKELDKIFTAIAASQGKEVEPIERKMINRNIKAGLRLLNEKNGNNHTNYLYCPKCQTELQYVRGHRSERSKGKYIQLKL